MSKNPQLASFEATLARQDEELRSFETILLGLGDVELRVPAQTLEDLDEVTKIIPTLTTPCFGVRG